MQAEWGMTAQRYGTVRSRIDIDVNHTSNFASGDWTKTIWGTSGGISSKDSLYVLLHVIETSKGGPRVIIKQDLDSMSCHYSRQQLGLRL